MPYVLRHLASYLESSAERFPTRRAVVDPAGRAITYEALNAIADRVASFLIMRGVGAGQRVGILMPKSIETVAAIFGIMKAGGAYVPVDPTGPLERARTIFTDCKVSALFLHETLADILNDWPLGARPATVMVRGGPRNDDKNGDPNAAQSVTWDDAIALAGADTAIVRDTGGLAYILYTSGSTGVPKGVQISHSTASSFIEWGAETFAPVPDDRFSSHAPFHFDLSIFDIFVAIRQGASVHLISEEQIGNPRQLAQFIAERDITVWYSTPSALTLLGQHGRLARLAYKGPRLVLFAGEVFPVKHLRQLTELWHASEWYNLYGPTETNVCTFARIPLPVPQDRYRTVSNRRPLFSLRGPRVAGRRNASVRPGGRAAHCRRPSVSGLLESAGRERARLQDDRWPTVLRYRGLGATALWGRVRLHRKAGSDGQTARLSDRARRNREDALPPSQSERRWRRVHCRRRRRPHRRVLHEQRPRAVDRRTQTVLESRFADLHGSRRLQAFRTTPQYIDWQDGLPAPDGLAERTRGRFMTGLSQFRPSYLFSIVANLSVLVALIAGAAVIPADAEEPHTLLDRFIKKFNDTRRPVSADRTEAEGYYEDLFQQSSRAVSVSAVVSGNWAAKWTSWEFTLMRKGTTRRRSDFLYFELLPNRNVPELNGRLVTNSFGLADREYTQIRRDGYRRVAFIGDSMTRGMGSTPGANYESLLENWFNETKPNPELVGYEFINFGVEGYRLTQMLEVVRTKAADFSPDCYVIGLSDLAVTRKWADHIWQLVNEGLDLKYRLSEGNCSTRPASPE